MSLHRIKEFLDRRQLSKAEYELLKYVKGRVYLTLTESKPRSPGIHVSNILPDCPRLIFYNYKLGQMFSEPEVWKLTIGKTIHERLKILEIQELPLEWNGIVTDGIDEYDPNIGLLIEKKVRFGPPPITVFPSHIRQLEYYRVLLRKNNYKARYAMVIYITPAYPEEMFHPRFVKFRPLKVIEDEMMWKKNLIIEHEINNTIPERRVSDECDIDKYFSLCFGKNKKE